MNFSYKTNPGYLDLVCDMHKVIKWHYRSENWDNYTFPDGFVKGLIFKKYVILNLLKFNYIKI